MTYHIYLQFTLETLGNIVICEAKEMNSVDNTNIDDLSRAIAWITRLSEAFREPLKSPIIQTYACSLAHDAFQMDDEMIDTAMQSFDHFPTIGELGWLFDKSYGPLEPRYEPLQLAKAAVDHWWPPVRGLGEWGRIAAHAWLTQQAMCKLERRHITRQKTRTGWVLRVPTAPIPPLDLAKAWLDEAEMRRAYVGE